jgi:hypothetical protein
MQQLDLGDHAVSWTATHILTALSRLGFTAWLLIDLDMIRAGQRWWSFLVTELAVGVVLFAGVTVPRSPRSAGRRHGKMRSSQRSGRRRCDPGAWRPMPAVRAKPSRSR